MGRNSLVGNRFHSSVFLDRLVVSAVFLAVSLIRGLMMVEFCELDPDPILREDQKQATVSSNVWLQWEPESGFSETESGFSGD